MLSPQQYAISFEEKGRRKRGKERKENMGHTILVGKQRLSILLPPNLLHMNCQIGQSRPAKSIDPWVPISNKPKCKQQQGRINTWTLVLTQTSTTYLHINIVFLWVQSENSRIVGNGLVMLEVLVLHLQNVAKGWVERWWGGLRRAMGAREEEKEQS